MKLKPVDKGSGFMSHMLKYMRDKLLSALYLCSIFAVIAAAYMFNLDRPLPWNDEAETMVVSRSLVKYPVPTADDGRNVLIFENCAQLNRDLVSKKIPWVQYYTAAVSESLFGSTAAGLRMLFALAGALAFFPLLPLLRPYFPHAPLIAALILLNPQVILFQRNARYYPLLILTYCLLLVTLFGEKIHPRFRAVCLAAVFIVFFQVHPLAAFGSWLTFSLYYALEYRGNAWSVWFCGTLGLVGWIGWYVWLGPSLSGGSEVYRASHLIALPIHMFRDGFLGSAIGVMDLDFINLLPLLFLPTVFLMGLKRTIFTKNRLYLFILGNLSIQIVLNAVVVGTETEHGLSLLRYLPHLIVGGYILLFAMFEACIRKMPMAVLLAALVFFTNIATVSFWFNPASRFSWWLPVYSEIMAPAPESLASVISHFEQHPSRTQTLGVSPSFLQPSFTFYLGNRYLVLPEIQAPSCAKAVLGVVGKERYSLLQQKPDHLVIFANAMDVPAGYEALRFPLNRASPDGARPELTRHFFLTDRDMGEVVVAHRIQ
jgi:hypothetical protein